MFTASKRDSGAEREYSNPSGLLLQRKAPKDNSVANYGELEDKKRLGTDPFYSL
jgi:hypothetical protein